MIIDSISIKNFKGIESLTVPLSQTEPTIITGRNGSGKTSLIHAFEFLWTGKNPTDQVRHEGLLRRGEESGFVALSTPAGSIRRTLVPHSLSIEGHRGKTIESATNKLSSLVGCELEDIGRAIRPDLFLQLKDAERAASLFDLLGIRISPDLVTERVKQIGTERDLPAEKVYVSAYGPIDGNLEAASKALRNDRRSRKKQLKEAQTIFDRMERDAANGNSPAFAEDVNGERYQWVQQEMAGVNQRLGAAAAGNARRKRLVEDLARLERDLGDPPCYDEEAAEAKAAFGMISAEIRGLGSANALKRDLRNLESDPMCQTCRRPFENDDAEARERRKAEIKDALFCIDALTRVLYEHEKVIKSYERYLFGAKHVEGLRVELSLLEEQDPSIYTDRLTELNAEFGRLQAQHTAAVEWATWSATKKASAERVEKLKIFVDTLDELVKLTDEGGLKAEVMAQRTGPAAEEISAILGNWDMSLTFSSQLDMMVRKNNTVNPVANLSDGETILVALAVQVWLAQKCGLRILVMDRLEALDDDNYNILIAAVESLLEADEIDHAILAGVDRDAWTVDLGEVALVGAL